MYTQELKKLSLLPFGHLLEEYLITLPVTATLKNKHQIFTLNKSEQPP